MKERPILFNSEMVRAVLEGRKSQTRRVIKNASNLIQDYDPKDKTYGPFFENEYGDSIKTVTACPYGIPGDRLWVRETWADVNTESGPSILYKVDSHISTWQEFSEEFGPDYGAGPSMNYDKYPGAYTMWWSDLLDGVEGHGWKPSIHMPRWASRILLEITDIRVERVQDIKCKDLTAEGIDEAYIRPRHRKWVNLWNSINEKKGFGWDQNPWCWCATFRVVQ